MIVNEAQLEQWMRWIDEGDLKEVLRAMQDKLNGLGRATAQELLAARENYVKDSDNNIEVDDDAHSYETADGIWVQAWVWLRNPGPATDKEPPSG